MVVILQVYLSNKNYMIYLVHTIKELKQNTINTDFVIESESEDEIKSLMGQSKVIVLALTPVSWRPKSWKFFGTFQTPTNKTLKFCIKTGSIESACSRCIELELPITSINDITNPITNTQSLDIINTIQQEKRNQYIQQEMEEAASKQRNKSMSDKKKDKIMSVVWETLKDINAMEEKNIINTNIPVNEQKKLHELKELLTKIKMWSNIEKATSILEETFTIMEKIENQSLISMKEEEYRIMNESIISNIDIISELDKLRRANQWNQAGTKKNSSDIYYTYLWIVWLYQKFIVKDMLHNLLEVRKVLTQGIEYIWFWISSIVTIFWLLFIYHIINNTLTQNILLIMIYIWLLGLSWELPFAVRKSSFFMSIIYIILAIIISIVIQKLLITNFALV